MKINLADTQLVGDDLAIAQEVLLNNGSLRKSRPAKASGNAQYVWRMAAFSLSSNSQHQRLPVMAEMYLNIRDRDERRARVAHLDTIVKAIVDSVPVDEQPGTMRWGSALGII